MKITIKMTCCIFVIALFFCSSAFAQENDSNKGKVITKDPAKETHASTSVLYKKTQMKRFKETSTKF
jgi:hypothetical protein